MTASVIGKASGQQEVILVVQFWGSQTLYSDF